jgi:Cyclic nucleotide-binding domain
VSVASQTLLQRSVRDDVTARVFGVNEGFIQLGMAAGSLLGPLLVGVLGAHAAFAIAGALMPLAAVLMTASLRRLDARSVVPAPIYDKLRAIPFLTPLPLRTVEQLARTSGRLLVEPGTTVVRQGDEGHQYFVVGDGRLDVVVDGDRIRRLETGDGFGEIALLRDTPRTASVIADTACDLVTIERAAFRSAILGVPTSADRASEHVTGWLESDARRTANRTAGS